MYDLILLSAAEKFLKKSDKKISEKILDKLEQLRLNPKIGIPLSANLAGLWKLRIGDYRVIYQIKNLELIVLVLNIDHRKKVYK